MVPITVAHISDHHKQQNNITNRKAAKLWHDELLYDDKQELN